MFMDLRNDYPPPLLAKKVKPSSIKKRLIYV